MEKKGIFAGSFDPITRGHWFLLVEAAKLMDKLYVVIGVNTAKKNYFTPAEKKDMIQQIVDTKLAPDLAAKIEIHFLEDDLLINFASEVGAQYLVRGIRSAQDAQYEAQILQVNRKINPKVQTLFLMPPAQLSEVSSSTVKGLVGFKGWEDIVGMYVHKIVLEAFKAKRTTMAVHPSLGASV